jgi:hypothetical protein
MGSAKPKAQIKSETNMGTGIHAFETTIFETGTATALNPTQWETEQKRGS